MLFANYLTLIVAVILTINTARANDKIHIITDLPSISFVNFQSLPGSAVDGVRTIQSADD